MSEAKPGSIPGCAMRIMTVAQTRTADDAQDDEPTEFEKAQQAYDAIGEALREIDVTHNYDLYVSVQRSYFDAKARLRALDPGFQAVDMDGTRVSANRSEARVLDGLQVCDPDNPHTTHGVTVDHVIEGDGSVRCEINAVPIDRVGTEQGSHLP